MARKNVKKTKAANPLLIVISGPSGVGKDAALDRMKKAGLPYHYVVTATTRPKRPGEKDGVDYWFISEDKFHQMVKKNQFLEWAKVYGNHYGVPKHEIKAALERGLDTVVKVDVQGAATIKRILPEALFIFLMPPSTKELANRMKNRDGLSSADLNVRLGKAQEEIASLPMFDYAITNYTDNLDLTAAQINNVINAAKCERKPMMFSL